MAVPAARGRREDVKVLCHVIEKRRRTTFRCPASSVDDLVGRPGGQLALTVQWRCLAGLDERCCERRLFCGGRRLFLCRPLHGFALGGLTFRAEATLLGGFGHGQPLERLYRARRLSSTRMRFVSVRARHPVSCRGSASHACVPARGLPTSPRRRPAAAAQADPTANDQRFDKRLDVGHAWHASRLASRHSRHHRRRRRAGIVHRRRLDVQRLDCEAQGRTVNGDLHGCVRRCRGPASVRVPRLPRRTAPRPPRRVPALRATASGAASDRTDISPRLTNAVVNASAYFPAKSAAVGEHHLLGDGLEELRADRCRRDRLCEQPPHVEAGLLDVVDARAGGESSHHAAERLEKRSGEHAREVVSRARQRVAGPLDGNVNGST